MWSSTYVKQRTFARLVRMRTHRRSNNQMIPWENTRRSLTEDVGTSNPKSQEMGWSSLQNSRMWWTNLLRRSNYLLPKRYTIIPSPPLAPSSPLSLFPTPLTEIARYWASWRGSAMMTVAPLGSILSGLDPTGWSWLCSLCLLPLSDPLFWWIPQQEERMISHTNFLIL